MVVNRILVALLIILSICVCLGIFAVRLHLYQYDMSILALEAENKGLKKRNEFLNNTLFELRKNLKRAKKLAITESKDLVNYLKVVDLESELIKQDDIYTLVSLTENRLYLKHKGEIKKEFVVSLGSGKVLKKKDITWLFETPVGIFNVLDKKENPVWIKPDWAFIEKKEPVPPFDSPKRIVRGFLGKFAIYLGGGYMIHGTPEEELVGMNITHGCIRLKEADLKEVFDFVKIGTKVLIR